MDLVNLDALVVLLVIDTLLLIILSVTVIQELITRWRYSPLVIFIGLFLIIAIGVNVYYLPHLSNAAWVVNLNGGG